MIDLFTKDILLVDDESGFLMGLADGLNSICPGRCNVLTASNGRIAVEMLRTITIDVVVTDVRMPEMDGCELIEHLKRHHPHIPVIVMTAYSDEVSDMILKNRQVRHLIEKPVDLYDIASKIIAA